MLSLCLIKHHAINITGVNSELHVLVTSALDWRWVFSFTIWPLYSPGSSPRQPLDPVWKLWRKYFFPLPGIESLFICHNQLPLFDDGWKNAGSAPRCLSSGTRRRWVVSFTPGQFYFRGKGPRYPLDMWLGGPQNRSAPCVDESIVPDTNWRMIHRLSKPWYIHYPGCIT
jgi:hypothetical protein